jgi:hypothetical protein
MLAFLAGAFGSSGLRKLIAPIIKHPLSARRTAAGIFMIGLQSSVPNLRFVADLRFDDCRYAELGQRSLEQAPQCNKSHHGDRAVLEIGHQCGILNVLTTAVRLTDGCLF